MVELESTESILVVEVKQVVCITKELWWINCKYNQSNVVSNCCFDISHPGFYGKTGMRVFHMQRNWKHCPTINTDKLWSLVTLDTRNKTNKDKTVPVIDVTRSVSARLDNFFKTMILLILNTNNFHQCSYQFNIRLIESID
jgi:hypothetical protein